MFFDNFSDFDVSLYQILANRILHEILSVRIISLSNFHLIFSALYKMDSSNKTVRNRFYLGENHPKVTMAIEFMPN